MAPIDDRPSWFALAMGLSGGLALFLYGLDQLSTGLKQAAGDGLRTLLSRLTSNRFLGAATGAVVTGILNSSSVTTVLVVGFVTAGVMSLSQSVAVIMGANIGSTVTAQILAFNLSAYALLPVALGFFAIFVGKRDAIRHWGMIIMGLGLVFYGMGVMSDAMRPLRSYPPFVSALARMENPVYGVLAGALFTGLVQSSAATVGLAIALASEGLLTLPAGIALALGANIGTCATALLASIGKPVEAVRAALVHVLFNVLGVALWLPLIGLLARLAAAVSPASPELQGVQRLAAEVPRQIANANTLFNVLNTALFIGFTGGFARLATRLVPRRQQDEPAKPRFLDAAAVSVPAVALEQVRQEIGRVGELVRTMLDEALAARSAPDAAPVLRLAEHRRTVQALEPAVLKFLGRIRKGNLTEKESRTHIALLTATIHLRELADVIATDLLASLARFRAHMGPDEAAEESSLAALCAAAQRGLKLAVHAVTARDAAAAAQVSQMTAHTHALANDMMASSAAVLRSGGQSALAAVRANATLVDALRQIFSLARRIARTVTDPASPDEEGQTPNPAPAPAATR
jgi:phosphate:Na+ symporter